MKDERNLIIFNCTIELYQLFCISFFTILNSQLLMFQSVTPCIEMVILNKVVVVVVVVVEFQMVQTKHTWFMCRLRDSTDTYIIN